MSKYSKLIVAMIGGAIMLAKQVWGVELGVTADQIMGVAVPLLTAFGVWAVPNEE